MLNKFFNLLTEDFFASAQCILLSYLCEDFNVSNYKIKLSILEQVVLILTLGHGKWVTLARYDESIELLSHKSFIRNGISLIIGLNFLIIRLPFNKIAFFGKYTARRPPS